MASPRQRVPAPLPNLLCTPRNAAARRFHRQDPPHPPRTVEPQLITKRHSRRSKQKLPVGSVILRLSRIGLGRIMVVVAHDQLLGAIQPSSDVNLGSAEGEVAKVPYGIALPDN